MLYTFGLGAACVKPGAGWHLSGVRVAKHFFLHGTASDLKDGSCLFPSMDWSKGKFTGKPHI